MFYTCAVPLVFLCPFAFDLHSSVNTAEKIYTFLTQYYKHGNGDSRNLTDEPNITLESGKARVRIQFFNV